MGTTLVLSFPWGRYHATPWGRHVNEGAVELPPSPWRLLRALYAVWRTRLPELDADTAHGLLAVLAKPPTFHVPRHTLAHTRHYYPDSTHTRAVPSTDRTLDAFAVFARGAELAAHWPDTLDAEQHAALTRLADAMPYFGRADSVCEARVADGWRPDAHETWTPVDTAESVPDGVEVTSVLAPELPLSLDALVARPVDTRKGSLLFPAGTRFVGYQRTTSAPEPATAPPPERAERVTAVRLAVAQTGAPPETDALAYTDLLRQAALAKLGRLREHKEHSVLGGKDAHTNASRTDHRHAHFLPIVRGRRVAGLVVWAPDGLPEQELDALSRVDELRSNHAKWKLTVRLAGAGTVDDVAPELTGAATVWESALPFTASRYRKRNRDEAEFLRAEIARELGYRDAAATPDVELLDGDWARFRRYRPSARMRRDPHQGQANRPARFLRLRFAEPHTGPLALGHLSHFGLGLFTPGR